MNNFHTAVEERSVKISDSYHEQGPRCIDFFKWGYSVYQNVSSIYELIPVGNQRRMRVLPRSESRRGRTVIKSVPLLFQENHCLSVDSCSEYVKWNPTHSDTWSFGLLGFTISISMNVSLKSRFFLVDWRVFDLLPLYPTYVYAYIFTIELTLSKEIKKQIRSFLLFFGKCYIISVLLNVPEYPLLRYSAWKSSL